MSLTLQVPAPREGLLAETLNTIAADPARMNSLLEYLPETGLLRHREVISGWLSALSIHATPDNILITNGGQHSNMMALKAATRPGDTIVSEALTYPGFINAARQWQTHHIGLPMVMAEVACEWIESGIAQQLIQWQTEAIARRQMLTKQLLKGMEIQTQPDSFHGWLKLPEPWRAETFVKQLQKKGGG